MISKVDSLEELSESERKRCATVRDENGAVVGYTVCKDADYEAEIEYLFKKVKMGADVIFTQMFFDADCYYYFVERCRAKGISVPIIPGIMCINSVPVGTHRDLTRSVSWLLFFCALTLTRAVRLWIYRGLSAW